MKKHFLVICLCIVGFVAIPSSCQREGMPIPIEEHQGQFSEQGPMTRGGEYCEEDCECSPKRSEWCEVCSNDPCSCPCKDCRLWPCICPVGAICPDCFFMEWECICELGYTLCPNCVKHPCVCPTCPDCGKKLQYCVCPTCPDCGVKLQYCACPPCPDCGMKTCKCTLCLDCGKKLQYCVCLKCPTCGKKLKDCSGGHQGSSGQCEICALEPCMCPPQKK